MELSVVESLSRSKKFIVRYNLLLPNSEYSIKHITSDGDISIINYRQSTMSAHYLIGVENICNVDILEEIQVGDDMEYNSIFSGKIVDVSEMTEV